MCISFYTARIHPSDRCEHRNNELAQLFALGQIYQLRKMNAQFSNLGTSLAELREAVTKSNAPEVAKLTVVADIETIQSQLAKPQPTNGIISAAWSAIKGAAYRAPLGLTTSNVFLSVENLFDKQALIYTFPESLEAGGVGRASFDPLDDRVRAPGHRR